MVTEKKGKVAGALRPMALKAVITIEFHAADFVEAADYQSRLRAAMQPLKQAFPQAGLKIIEHRRRAESPIVCDISRGTVDKRHRCL